MRPEKAPENCTTGGLTRPKSGDRLERITSFVNGIFPGLGAMWKRQIARELHWPDNFVELGILWGVHNTALFLNEVSDQEFDRYMGEHDQRMRARGETREAIASGMRRDEEIDQKGVAHLIEIGRAVILGGLEARDLAAKKRQKEGKTGEEFVRFVDALRSKGPKLTKRQAIKKAQEKLGFGSHKLYYEHRSVKK